jgi:acetylornithine/N-succinyldiaminopimelate aminotransferase
VARLGPVLRQTLAQIEDQHPSIIESVRGEGLMFGIKTRVPNTEFAAAALKAKLLTIPAGDNVVRLLPPLIIDEQEIAEAARRLGDACARLRAIGAAQ